LTLPLAGGSIAPTAGIEIADAGDFLPAQAGATEDLAKVLYMCGRFDESRATLDEAVRLYELKGNVLAARRVRALAAQPASPPS
jgi:hypothetical protein